MTKNMNAITLAIPNPSDSMGMYELVCRSAPLDVNSQYLYMLIGSHFRNTSVVAKRNGKTVGMVSGYTLPGLENILFIWQVAVDKEMRGRGLAFKMLQSLLKRNHLQNIEFIDTNISPSNIASQKLFEKLATSLDTTVVKKPCFSKELFGEVGHEDEDLYRVGPIKMSKDASKNTRRFNESV